VATNNPTDTLNFDDLVLIAEGHTAFQLLWAGVELGVFSLLAKCPRIGKDEIAKRLSIEAYPTRILLLGLTALRLIFKEGDEYRNSAAAENFLVKDNPENLVDVLGWQAHIVYRGELDFVESLRQGTNVGLRQFPGDGDNLYARLAQDPPLEAVFHRAMDSISRMANALLTKTVDLTTLRHLVDAGGGDGTNAITLARAYQHLDITVFDSPSVCVLAEENIRHAGLSSRIRTHSGNFFTDSYPTDIDCILFAHILTIWSPEENILLLRRAFDALPSGGKVIIFNMMGNDDQSGPLTAALGSPYFLSIATGKGMLYSWQEYESFVHEAGFIKTERVVLPRDHGVLIGRK
jgi:tRNA A58 N-methylase Trm61